MPDSIQEQIMKKMAAALSSITVANGSANTIASVQRHNQHGMNLASVPTILIREGDCIPELEQSARPWTRRRMEVFAVVVTRQDESATSTDTRSGGEILNSLVADVETRIGASQTWDGLAMFTDPPSYLEVELDATTPHLARGLRFETVYEHVRTNPYSQTP